MKFLFLLLSVTSLQVFAEDFKETITISKKNASLKEIFRMVQKQSDYSFAYTDPMLSRARPVDIDVKNAGIEQVLSICFKEQPLEYEIDNNIKVIIVKEKKKANNLAISSMGPTEGILSVKGKVTDEDGNPIPRASVIVKGTTKATATNENGEFLFDEITEKAVLIFSCVGYEAQQIAIKGKGNIDAQLKVVANSLDETIVVAYNTSTQRANTGSVTVVKGKSIETFPNRSFEKSLQGMVPGLQITTGSGLPGGGVGNIVIRGIGTGSSLTYGSTVRNPLIVIDGTPATQDHFNFGGSSNITPISNPMAQINPSDIESITVLKDASAISLYGTRASNGVILVTTKKGKAGKTKINFRHQTDISERVKAGREILNQDQYLELLFESYRNSKPGITDAAIKSDLYKKFPVIVKTPGDTSFYTAPNWYDELYSNHALTVSNDLSFSGGNEKVNYYLNLNYVNQTGILKNTGYKRASVRYNTSIRPVSWFTVGINSTVSYNKQNHAGTAQSISSANGFPAWVSPLLPIRNADGNYILFYPYGAGDNFAPNPKAAMEWNTNRFDAYRGIGNVFAELNFLRYFSMRANLGVDFMVSNSRQKVDPRLVDQDMQIGSTGIGRIQITDVTRSSIIATNTLRYNRTFINTHSINFLVGQEAQVFKNKLLNGSATGFSSPYYNNMSFGTTRTSSESFNKETLLSYFAQGNYSYKSKYFLDIGLRRDGSSKFGFSERYANFWSVGAGWVLTEESWLTRTSGWLDYFKLRGSMGTSGNSNTISSDTRFSLISPSYYPETGPALTSTTIGNPDIKWEKTFNTDLGLEARFWKERIQVTADIYKRKINDLIYTIAQPLTTGQSRLVVNYGDMENSGIELSLSVDVIRNKNFKWNINGNWSTNKNKLIKANFPITFDGSLINKEGENFNSFYFVRWAGVDPTDGLPQWLDSTGKITKSYNSLNRVSVGKPQPDGFGAVNTTVVYKNLEITAFFYYTYGFQAYNSWLASMNNDGAGRPYNNQSTMALNRWQKPGDIALNPKRILNNPSQGTQASTRWLSDGDYIRFKNVLMTYSFLRPAIGNVKFRELKVFIQANNIALWTKSAGLDPDNTGPVGINESAYPLQKSFSIGLNVGF